MAGHETDTQNWHPYISMKDKLKKNSGKQCYSHYPQNYIIGVNSTNGIKDLYDENFKTQKKEIELDTVRWKDFLCLQFGRRQYCEDGHLTKSNV